MDRPGRSKPRLSLKGRALQLLAQREQSRVELARKLGAHARLLAADAVGDEADATDAQDRGADGLESQVEAVLDWLYAEQFASDERFAESRVHARAARQGNLRIRSELAQHGVAASAELLQQLQASEFERAWQVWERKFGQPPLDGAAQAKQARFLAARGFSPEVARRVLRQAGRAAPAERGAAGRTEGTEGDETSEG